MQWKALPEIPWECKRPFSSQHKGKIYLSAGCIITFDPDSEQYEKLTYELRGVLNMHSWIGNDIYIIESGNKVIGYSEHEAVQYGDVPSFGFGCYHDHVVEYENKVYWLSNKRTVLQFDKHTKEVKVIRGHN